MFNVLVPCANAIVAMTTDTLMEKAANTTHATPVPLTEFELFKSNHGCFWYTKEDGAIAYAADAPGRGIDSVLAGSFAYASLAA